MAESSKLKDEVERILVEARRKGILIRLSGCHGIRIRCPHLVDFIGLKDAEPLHLEFFAYGNKRVAIGSLLKELGYVQEKDVVTSVESQRETYADTRRGIRVKVSYDSFKMNHAIEFQDRLELAYPTITLSDLFLQVIQKVKLEEKGFKGLGALLKEYPLGYDDRSTINANYISKKMSADWGFYYTATTNLRKIKEYFRGSTTFDTETRAEVDQKIDGLLAAMEKHPKTLSWKLRSKVGTSVRWYHEVES